MFLLTGLFHYCTGYFFFPFMNVGLMVKNLRCLRAARKKSDVLSWHVFLLYKLLFPVILKAPF